MDSPGPTRVDPLSVGIEIGGTKLQLALGRGDGRLSAARRATINPANGANGILLQIVAEYHELLKDAGLSQNSIQAIGVGFGGPVDVKNGIIETSHQVEGWTEFPLAAWLRDRFNVARVGIENDADAAGLGEAKFGAGIGCSPLVYVTIGSGIGGALILDGRIYRGAGRGAVEIGHIRMGTADDSPTLEAIASGWSIGRAAASLKGQTEFTAVDVAEAARQGDSSCRAILHSASQALGQALAHVVTLLSPRRIILGGGVSLIGEDLWFAPIRQVLQTRAFPYFIQSCDLVPARLGEFVVLHGALATALDLLD